MNQNVFLETNFENLSSYDLGQLKLSRIQAKPCLKIQYANGCYFAILGSIEINKGRKAFVPLPSKNHDWVMLNSSIKQLPRGIKEQINGIIGHDNWDDIGYPKILELKTNGAQLACSLEFSDEIFTCASVQAEETKSISIPDTIIAKLYPYQEQGVSWMWRGLQKLGGVILADEMGLGKTLQVISLICLAPKKEECPVLIACPSSLLANWQREIYKFAPSLSCMIHQGSNRVRIYTDLLKQDVVVTTYDTLCHDLIFFEDVKWSMLVCDEAQALKNPESIKRSKINTLYRKYTVMMTGTPIENSLLDLWSISDLAVSNSLGTREEFEANYPDSKEGAEKLTEVASPLVLKRLVRDVAKDLPERTNIEFPLEMDESLSAEYKRIESEVKGKYGSAGALVATGQMVLFCAHPWLQAKEPENPWEGEIVINNSSSMPLMTPKMEALVQLLNEVFRNRKKVLVFAAFNKCRELIEMAALNAGLPKAYWNQINGSTPSEERQPIIDEFSNTKGPGVLILNPRAAGTGLNITAATTVVHFTQYWNPAIEAQASKRAHRNGQKEHVNVYYLIYKDSVEEDMMAKVEWKAELAEAAISPTLRFGKSKS